MIKLIYGGIIVNEDRAFLGSILIHNNQITDIIEGSHAPCVPYDEAVDATGCFVLPGIIDEHVHFREPGLTAKADINSESRAAAYGGITSFLDMPNTSPQTTSIEAFQQKMEIGRQNSHINYAFFYGATNNNVDTFDQLDQHTTPGIKLFMGASTGNMLVDRKHALEQIFERSSFPIMTHCEDSSIIQDNMKKAKEQYGDDPDITLHPSIRNEEACYESTKLAVSLAKKYGSRLHVAHLTTERELAFFGHDDRITAEAVIAHLIFNDNDYQSLGTAIKCNPAVKKQSDQMALRKALTTGQIYTVATDHAPHLLQEKQGGCAKAASGMPMIQFSLPSMLELVDEKVISIEQLVTLMCHHPASLFEINQRGFIRKGYYADITIVKPNSPWAITTDCIQSKCKWSPLTGHTFNWKVVQTICNGHSIYANGRFDDLYRGKPLSFR